MAKRKRNLDVDTLIRDAVENEEIAISRYENYLTFLEEEIYTG